jgi:hypothetical protein
MSQNIYWKQWENKLAWTHPQRLSASIPPSGAPHISRVFMFLPLYVIIGYTKYPPAFMVTVVVSEPLSAEVSEVICLLLLMHIIWKFALKCR